MSEYVAKESGLVGDAEVFIGTGLGHIHNLWMCLPDLNDTEMQDVDAAIRQLQGLLALRVVKRSHPDYWV